MADELVTMSRFFTGGIPIDEDTLALEAIERVGKGSGTIFLMDDHTFEHFETSLFLPNLLDRSRFDAWETAGGMDLYARCKSEVKRILSEHRVETKPEEVVKGIDGILKGS